VRGRPATERGEVREWRGDLLRGAVSRRGHHLEYGAFRRLPMRPEAPADATPGLPHRTTRSVSAQRDGVRSSTPSGRTGRSAASWDKLENLSGSRWSDGMRHSHHVVAPTVARGPIALPPAPSRSHPGTVDRALFRGRGGTRAAGPRASHRSDSPTPARGVGSASARGVESTPGDSTSQLTLGRSPTRGGAAAS